MKSNKLTYILCLNSETENITIEQPECDEYLTIKFANKFFLNTKKKTEIRFDVYQSPYEGIYVVDIVSNTKLYESHQYMSVVDVDLRV